MDIDQKMTVSGKWNVSSLRIASSNGSVSIRTPLLGPGSIPSSSDEKSIGSAGAWLVAGTSYELQPCGSCGLRSSKPPNGSKDHDTMPKQSRSKTVGWLAICAIQMLGTALGALANGRQTILSTKASRC